MERTLVVMVLAAASHIAFTHKSVYPTGYPEKCLNSTSHKPAPTAETGDFQVCGQYKSKSCCSRDTANQHALSNSTGMNHINRNCGPLSERCHQYMMDQGCFYYCEPMIQKYELSSRPGNLIHVPICGRYCDAWFNACKDDMTCLKDWAAAFYSGGPVQTDCAGQQCVTFQQMYGNATEMCNHILGEEYVYTASNENCMVMKFSGENPNVNGNNESSGATPVTAQTAALGLICLLVMFLRC